MYRFIQRHYIRRNPGRRFLISESVRGEGAVLYNKNKERFVDELLPRDVVTKAIREEMKKGWNRLCMAFYGTYTERNYFKSFPEHL